MVRVHPRTGRKCIYYSEGAISHVEGMTPEASAPILEAVRQHVLRPEFQYRHVWRVGDVVMWDNCSCIHKASADFDLPKRRRMHRTTLGVARSADQRGSFVVSTPARKRIAPVAAAVGGTDLPSPIDRITTRFVSVPLPAPIKHPFLGARTRLSSLLVEVHTTDGITGFGYASIESLRLCGAINEIVRDLEAGLKGLDALRHEFVWERMYNLTVDILHDGAANLAMTAIDVALWDIVGKRAGLPLWKLLGGFRSQVPAYASWTLWRHMTNAELESETAAGRGAGLSRDEAAPGRRQRTLAEDAVRAKLVRDVAGPDAAIMVDALWGMSATDGVAMARMLGELGYAWFEEPVREGDFAGLARVRDVQALPVAAWRADLAGERCRGRSCPRSTT